jgi:hypothetical protein
MIMAKSQLVQRAQAVQPAFGNACYVVEVQLSVGQSTISITILALTRRTEMQCLIISQSNGQTYKVLMFLSPQNAPSSGVRIELRRNLRTLRPSKP